jgi:hypothetical protein
MDLDLAVQVSRRPVSGEDFAFATSDTDAAFLVLAHLPGSNPCSAAAVELTLV